LGRLPGFDLHQIREDPVGNPQNSGVKVARTVRQEAFRGETGTPRGSGHLAQAIFDHIHGNVPGIHPGMYCPMRVRRCAEMSRFRDIKPDAPAMF